MRPGLLKSWACEVVILAGAGIAIHAAASKSHLDSRWRDRDIVVDGSNLEWPGPLVQLDDKTPIVVEAMNDGTSLYLAMHVSDPMTRSRITRQGLVVWFDPSGKDKKAFGIKYPVGSPGGGMRGRSGGERGMGQGYPGQGGRSRDRGSSDDPDQPDPGSVDVPNRLEVLGPKKDDIRSFVADRAPGIEVKIGQVEGALVYELKVPLVKSREIEYAIGAQPGALIGIGLETPKIESPREGMTAGRGGGMGGGGMGGGMGGRGRGGGMGGMGGGRGMGGSRGGEEMKPLKAWGLLQLAKAS